MNFSKSIFAFAVVLVGLTFGVEACRRAELEIDEVGPVPGKLLETISSAPGNNPA